LVPTPTGGFLPVLRRLSGSFSPRIGGGGLRGATMSKFAVSGMWQSGMWGGFPGHPLKEVIDKISDP